jgi:hypothetical protein
MRLNGQLHSLIVNISKPGGLLKGDNYFNIDGSLDNKNLIGFRALLISDSTEVIEGNSLPTNALGGRNMSINLLNKKGDVKMNTLPYSSATQDSNSGQLFTFGGTIDTRQCFIYCDKNLLNTYAAIEFYYL